MTAFSDGIDDSDEWLRQQATQGRASLQQPAAAEAPAQPWARARELMDRQAVMQYQAPERFSKPVEAEPLQKIEDWKGYLAMLLNLVGDNGRGIGDIYGKQVDNRNKQIATWQKANSPQALAEREMQMAQLRNADRQGFEADRRVLGDQIGQEMQVAGAEQAQANNERNFDNQQQQFSDTYTANATNHADSVRLQESGQKQQADLARAQMAQSAGLAGASRAQADRHFQAQQAQHLLDQEEALNARRDAYAHSDKSQQAGFEHDTDSEIRKAQTTKDVYDLSHPAPVAPEGWRVKPGQDAQFRQSMGSPKVMSDILTEAGNAKQINTTLDELVRLRKEPSSAANKRLYDAAIKSLIGDRSQEGSTGVLSSTEFARYIEDLPEYGSLGNVSTMRGALDVLQNRDPAVETLAGIKKNYRTSKLAKMSPYGVEYDDAAPSQAAATKPEDDPTVLKYGMKAY
jgi:hypothetical protein